MKKLIFTLLFIPYLALAQSQDQNYIKSTTYKQATTTSITNPTIEQANVQISYFDGLGRPIQQIAHKQASNGKDIVTHIEYDAFDRQTKDYLPFTKDAGLEYLDASSALGAINSFYTYYNGGTTNPYGEKLLESSPVNRVLKQAAPGNDWQIDNGKGIKFEYDINTIDDKVLRFESVRSLTNSVYNNTISCVGYYNPNSLYKNVIKDENWVSGKNNTTEEFKNNMGRVILKRTYNNDENHDTYYVYDSVGNLIYVIPPLASVTVATVEVNEVPLLLNLDFYIDCKDFLISCNNNPNISGGGGLYLNIHDVSSSAYNFNGNFNCGFTSAKVDITKTFPLDTSINLPNCNLINFYNYTVYIENNIIKFKNNSTTFTCMESISGSFSGTNGGNISQPPTNTYEYTFTNNFSAVEKLCYQYKYDSRNRLVEKKLPGKQWEFIVYDKLDRPVATGPANNPFGGDAKGWMITKYDAFGRVAYTGWFNGTTATAANRNTFQNQINGLTVLNVNRVASAQIDNVTVGYNNTVYPTNIKLLTVNYYDNYTYPNPPSIPSQVLGVNTTIQVKGLPTGSWVRVLESPNAVRAEISHTVYDEKYRPVRSYTKNHLGGYTQVDSDLDDFNGKVLQTITTHKRTSSATEMEIVETFEYTPQDRLLKHKHQVNGDPEVTLTENQYDELGQLVRKITGDGLQEIDYKYNIRGWLTAINEDETAVANDNLVDLGAGDLFAFKISYNELLNPVGNTQKLYNGNISETFWITSTDNILRQYGYEYDKLNRLKKANFVRPYEGEQDTYNESLSYDKNGNIIDLQRNGRIYGDIQEIDNLVYNYEGNQLMKVTDSSNSTQGFNDGFDQAGVNDYSYDENGNMTKDLNKGIGTNTENGIIYNHLNLPTQIIFANGNRIHYFYNAVGQKVNKNVRTGNEYSDTDYLGGFQYRSSYTEAQGNLGVKELQYFPMAEGYIEHKEGRFFYIYHYTDHLGNIRLSYTFDENVGMIRIMEESHYYPFGLKHESYNTQRLGYTDFINEDEVKEYILQEQPRFVGDGSYNYKYNGKEYQDELGLNMYDMDMRQYDPAIGRWVVQDPITHHNFSPYSAFDNNPVYFADPSGADSESPFMDWLKNIFKSSNSGDTWTNNGSNDFTNSRTGKTSTCADCKLEGGRFDGKTYNNLKTGESPWYVRIFGINTITSKDKKSWGVYDKFLENEIEFLSDIQGLEQWIAGYLGVSSTDVLKSMTKIKNAKDLINNLKKIKTMSPKQIYALGLGIALYLESEKLGRTINQLKYINNNNAFELNAQNGVYLITTTHIVQTMYGSTTTTITDIYSQDNEKYIGRIQY